MASMASAARDIHQASPRDLFTEVAARSAPVTRSHPLPTPPNSISPALPPHGLKAQLQKARLEPIDSDLDLHQDSQPRFDTARHPGQHPGSLSDEPSGTITPALLGKHYLPEILLNHGPLAIRHIMGYLTTSVSGFASIPPTKARRLVVGALEGRGSGGEGGGVDGDVVFEKVGWGRWDARRRGQPSRARQPSPNAASAPYATSIPIAKNGGWPGDRTRLHPSTSSVEDAAFSHDDRQLGMMETEADRMSMDGSASASCSEAPDDDIEMNDDSEDQTDDEDWAAVGAAALRASSYSRSDGGNNNNKFPPSNAHTSGSGWRSVSANAGMARAPQPPNFNFSALASEAQEREAIEALLQLGSV